MNNGRGGINISAADALAAINDVNRFSWTVEKCAQYLNEVRARFQGNQQFNIFASNCYKKVRGASIFDRELIDFNITPAELMLLNKTKDADLIQEIAKTGSKNLLKLCFEKNMITDAEHVSDYFINIEGLQIVNCLYNVLAWFGCNDILKALFKKDEFDTSKYSAGSYGGISISVSGDYASCIIHHAGQKNDYTPIMLAAKAGHFDVVQTLCENINIAEYISRADSNNDTAKHHAARAGRKDIMEYLEKYDKNQDTNLQDKTPNQLFEDFQKVEAVRKQTEFNRNLAKVAMCALVVVSVALVCYNRAAIANMLGFGKSGLSVA